MLWPLVPVLVAVAFGLWSLWPETTQASFLNDTTVHQAMVRWARRQVQGGHVPLDGWYPYLQLGASHFHHYQVLPHILIAYVAVLVGAGVAFHWANYLLLATWPISVFAGARKLDWDAWTAGGAALVSPLLVSASGFGAEHASYLWQGYGLWPQLFGMWLMPLAVGLGRRAVSGRGGVFPAALAGGLTVALHFVVGYVALSFLAVWVVGGHPREIPRRVLRAMLVAIGAVSAAAWELVPLVGDHDWLPASSYGDNTFYTQSFGASRIMSWLVTGRLYDQGRLAVVSLLVAAGVLVCVTRVRRSEPARVLVVAWLFCLVLFFGPTSLGPLVGLLPFGSSVPLHRYIIGVHLTGLVLAGVGLAWLGGRLLAVVRRVRLPRLARPVLGPAVVAALTGAMLWPAVTQVAAYDAAEADYKAYQSVADATDGADLAVLIDQVRAEGGGRVYAGNRANWGAQYKVGYVPVFSVLQNQDIDAIGFTLRIESMMQEPEVLFDENNPAQYDMLNVRYLLLPSDHPPPVKATLEAQRGRHRLWRVETSSYLEVVDTTGPPIVSRLDNTGAASAAFTASPQLGRLQYPTLAYNGRPAADPTLVDPAVVRSSPGSVVSQSQALDEGLFSGVAVANRSAVVLLKASFDPRWRATVDGTAATPQMLAPGMVGVRVPAGRHVVAFSYVPYAGYPLLLGLAVVVLTALGLGPLLLRRSRFGVHPGGSDADTA